MPASLPITSQRRWKLAKAPMDTVAHLRETLKIHEVLCRLIALRGISTFEAARDYFRPSLEQLHSPFLMKDMGRAVERVLAALNSHERILVFGDYDVDGVTSVTCMYHFLKSLGADVHYYIPHRFSEGYGVSRQGIEKARELECKLIISLDCGIKSVSLVAYAQELGMDFIICDHHLPDEILPPAVAILNTRQADCEYPYKELCGCGVGLKLIQALCIALSLPGENWQQYFDLVAIAIAADIVPVTGENRVLVYYGLQKINSHPRPGIKAIFTLAGVKKQITVSNLVFIVAPRINAAGRMDHAGKAVDLFLEQDEAVAMKYAEELQKDNQTRKETEKSIVEQAIGRLALTPGLESRYSTVLYDPGWHKGVVGIVASRVIEQFYRPTIILAQNNGKISGSARSVNGVNLYEAIHACRSHLLNYGGHYHAAGITLLEENLDAFCTDFEKEIEKQISLEKLIPQIVMDAEMELKDVNYRFFNIIRQMEPFGPGNMRPVFMARGLTDTGQSCILKDEHLRIMARQGNYMATGIAFNMADKFPLISSGQPFDLVFTLEENVWQNTSSLQLMVHDIKASRGNA